MVLGAMEGSSPSFPPPDVSVTTKSMGLSVERPICRDKTLHQLKYLHIVSTVRPAFFRRFSHETGFKLFVNVCTEMI